VSKRSEAAYINGAPSTPGYLLALLRELLHVPRGLQGVLLKKITDIHQGVLVGRWRKYYFSFQKKFSYRGPMFRYKF